MSRRRDDDGLPLALAARLWSNRSEPGTADRVAHGYTWAIKRTHIMLTHRQASFLADERARTGLSLAELIRRAIDATYREQARPTVAGFELSVGAWRRPDAAVVGRRTRTRFRS